MSRHSTHTSELVPLEERQRYVQGVRALVVGAVMALALTRPGRLLMPAADVALISGGFAIAALVTQTAGRMSRTIRVRLFGLMLIVDGVYLAWASWVTGAGSAARYLVILHLITVALLASYRTGMKLAFWDSLLLQVVHQAQKGGVLPHTPGADLGMESLITFAAVLWIVTLATATFSAVNERELRRRRYDLEAFARMTARMESAADPATVAAILLEDLRETFDFARAAVISCREGEGASVMAGHGLAEASGSCPQRDDRSVIAGVLGERSTRLLGAFEPAHDAWLASLLPDARNVVVMPLVAEDESMGVVVAEHGRRVGARIERRVVSTAERFAAHGALALANAWLLERIRRMASTDGLTGVANRRSLEQAIEAELARAARAGEDASLVMLDVDHFKRLNDTYGHQAGDEVLRRVAAELQAGVRSFDTVGRYGGEEFAVVLPRSGAAEAAEIAERLRVAIEQSGTEPGVTVSAGVATFPLDAVAADALFGAADGALYASKAAGRNRVTAASRPALAAPRA